MNLTTKEAKLADAVRGCVDDLLAFPDDKGIRYLVIDRLHRIASELEAK